jgi:hypothetical protein
MKKYHYTYYSYEEFGRGYIGKRSCDCNPEEDVTYFGSYKDKTFKPTQKIILEIYDTPTEAIAAEIKLQHFFKVVPNSHFANRVYQTSTKFQGNSETARKANASRTPEQRRENAKKANASLTTEQRRENIKKANASLTIEQRRENAKKGNEKRTPEQRSESARKREANKTPEQRSESARKAKAKLTSKQRSEIAINASSKLTLKQRSEIGKKVAFQRWQCTKTGFITNAGNLSHYQKARGIDTSNRVRLS